LRGCPAIGVLTVAATSRGPALLFADKLVEVLKEADDDNKKRAGDSHEEDPGAEAHHGAGQNDHTRILNQAGMNPRFISI
jgi:hypothetical protein